MRIRVSRNRFHQQAIKFCNVFEEFSEWSARNAWWSVTIISSLFLLFTGLIASTRMLWNDELFTLYISRLGSFSDIITVLSTGADQSPPSFYFLTHIIFLLLGESHLAIRLPEMFGVLCMSLCLYRFVSKRTSAVYGLAALVFPLITIAYEYAYEARPYGLVLGFSSLALLFWQEATEKPQRVWRLIGLTVSGAAAISSHYYAIFLVVPLGAGEIIRTFTRKRLDLPIWIALSCMLVPLVLFYPIIQNARNFAHHFWSPSEWVMIPKFYYVLLIPALGPIVATLTVFSVWPLQGSMKNPSISPPPVAFYWHEITAAIGFIAIPAVEVVLGKLVMGAFTYRYALPAVIGFSILFPLSFQKIDCYRPVTGGCFTLFSCLWFVVMGAYQFNHETGISTVWSNTYEFLQREGDPNLSIVVGDPHTLMRLAHYGPPSLTSRAVYLANPQASLRYFGHDTVDRGMLDLRPWFPIRVEEYAPYLASHDRFLVYTRVRGDRTWLGYFWGSPWDWSWLLYELSSTYEKIELIGRNDDDLLFLVTAKP